MNHRRWRFAVSKYTGTLRLAILLSIVAALVAWRIFEPAAWTQHASPRLASTLQGYARAVDGDTIELSGTRIRLHGIDAPESAQTCLTGTLAYRCGERATLALIDLVRGQIVRCEPTGLDQYHRTIARCTIGSGGVDINARLVREGLAVAYRRYSDEYVPDETIARIAKRGLWAGTFQMPWDYRAETRNERIHPGPAR